jgi:hypothetical protein
MSQSFLAKFGGLDSLVNMTFHKRAALKHAHPLPGVYWQERAPS